mgnify:CR=1 FL=1
MKSLYTVNSIIVGLLALILYLVLVQPQARDFTQTAHLPEVGELELIEEDDESSVFLDNGYELLALKDMSNEDLLLAFPQVRSSLLYHFAHDKEGTLTWSLSLPQATHDAVLEILIKSWASKEPVAVSEWLEKSELLNVASLKICLLLVEGWAQKTPVIAAIWIGELKDVTLQKACREVLVDAWAKSAPESLESWLSSVRDKASIKKALSAIVHFRVEANLEVAFTWALQSDLLDNDSKLLFLKKALKKSFEETRSFMQINKAFINSADLPILFEGLSQDNAEALIETYSALAESDFFYKELILQNAKANFSRALLLLPKIESESLKVEILTDLAILEVQTNPELAMKIFAKIPVVEMKKLAQFSSYWAESEPDKLSLWLFSWDMNKFFGVDDFLEVPISEQRSFIYAAMDGKQEDVSFLDELEEASFAARTKAVTEQVIVSIKKAAKSWAQQDYLASQVFLLSLKKGLLKDAFLAGVIEASGAQNALSLFSLLDACSSETVYKDFYVRCCLKLALLNGYEAKRRLDKQGLDDQQIYLDLVDAWSSKQPVRALHYAQQLASLYKAQSYSLIFKNWFKLRPAEAFQKMLSITDPVYRQRALKAYIAMKVHSKEAPSAEEWQGLSQADKAYLNKFKLNKK